MSIRWSVKGKPKWNKTYYETSHEKKPIILNSREQRPSQKEKYETTKRNRGDMALVSKMFISKYK